MPLEIALIPFPFIIPGLPGPPWPTCHVGLDGSYSKLYSVMMSNWVGNAKREGPSKRSLKVAFQVFTLITETQLNWHLDFLAVCTTGPLGGQIGWPWPCRRGRQLGKGFTNYISCFNAYPKTDINPHSPGIAMGNGHWVMVRQRV